IGGTPMTSNRSATVPSRAHPRIKVVGVGGGGGNVVNGMIQSGLSGVEFICVNADPAELKLSHASRRLATGAAVDGGRGEGGGRGYCGTEAAGGRDRGAVERPSP